MKENTFSEAAISALPADELLKLDNQLCFSLYVCSKEVIKRYKPLLEPYNLTYTGYITLMALWEKDDINVKELGEKLFLDSGTLTPLLKKLEKQGYISRIRDKQDERNIRIQLTKEGKNLKDIAVCVPKQMLDELPVGGLKAYKLQKALHTLMEALAEAKNG